MDRQSLQRLSCLPNFQRLRQFGFIPKLEYISVTPWLGGSTRGNRCVSLNEPQLPETHPKTRKAFSTIARLKNETLALFLIKSKNGNLINQTKILPKIRQNPVCNKDYPLPRNINKNIYTKCIHPSMGYSSSYKS